MNHQAKASEMPNHAKHHASERVPQERTSAAWWQCPHCRASERAAYDNLLRIGQWLARENTPQKNVHHTNPKSPSQKYQQSPPTPKSKKGTYIIIVNPRMLKVVVTPSQNEGFYNNLGGWNVTNVVVIPSQNEGFYNQARCKVQHQLVVIPSQNEGFYN